MTILDDCPASDLVQVTYYIRIMKMVIRFFSCMLLLNGVALCQPLKTEQFSVKAQSKRNGKGSFLIGFFTDRRPAGVEEQ